MHIGLTTRSILKKHLNEGIITEHQLKKFYEAVRLFYERACEYAIADDVLQSAQFLNFESREAAQFSSVEFFVRKYNYNTIIIEF